MIRPKAQTNLKNARDYFREHLRVGDYYAEGQTIRGEWLGKGAETLGLNGQVGENDFLALCDGLDPRTNRRLTLRLNSIRQENGRELPGRRIFYDFTVSPPKSVSIVALYHDSRIVDLHHRAVRVAMGELEKFAETRVRKSKQDGERLTGQIVAACFRHDTSRELDPHLHTHCIVFNATFDPVEQRWKALHASGMYRAQKFAENLYYHELSKGLRTLGYEIENNARDFEIKGVSPTVIARFSKRHMQINLETNRRVAREGVPDNLAALREQIAHGKRRRKQENSTASELRASWAKQISPMDQDALQRLCRPGLPHSPAEVRPFVAWADQQLFERRSVVQDYELMSAALARGRGENFTLSELTAAIETHDYVREAGTRRFTSREVLGRELDLVLAAADGRLMHAPLAPNHAPDRSLSHEQAMAVRQILESRDFITLFRGAAGVGKSHAIKDVVRGLRGADYPVVILAPQRQQVHDLQQDGLAAQTLAQILTTRELPERAVAILDESGQVGAREMHALMSLVKARDGRLILSGDTRQHGAVTASDALRAIERNAGLKPAEIRTIRRQDPALGRSASEKQFIREYRFAVRAASAGKAADSFDRLDRLGCIREHAHDERRAVLAAEYVAATGRGEKTLVVAQTWDEVRGVNNAIRSELRAAGRIEAGTALTTYQTLDRTEAQKRDPRFYESGQYAFFLRRYGRFAKGDLCEVRGADERGVSLAKAGRVSRVSFRYAERMAVASSTDMDIAPGDRLQLKFNGRSAEGVSISNGELVTVRQVEAAGGLIVENDAGVPKTLTPQQRLFNRGYAVTSYAAQGKTVETVLVADSGCKAATNSNQWYVAISRARRKAIIFTDDKAGLRAMIQKSGDRDLALDMKASVAASPGNPTSPIPRRKPTLSMPANLHRRMMQETISRHHGGPQIRHHL